jgi:hypothetical protein
MAELETTVTETTQETTEATETTGSAELAKLKAEFERQKLALDKAMKAYGEAGKKLAPNGQSITTTAIKLAKMGARKGKHIERALQDVDEIGALEEGDRE